MSRWSSARAGYWVEHEYHRLNVKDYVDEFCGWKAMTELINLIPIGIQRSFFVTMFQTGGRASEVLLLKKKNFTVMPSEGIVKVEDMRLLKRYEKLDSYVADGKKHWHTQILKKYRKPFTIQRREPCTSILERHLDSVKQPEAYLFPSPYNHHRKFREDHTLDASLLDVNKQVPYTVVWAYLNIREVNRNASTDLKERLGLMRAFLDEKGNPISDEIHLWLHWFRSQRASQLVNDYNFDEMDLLGYFSWEDIQTALRYAKKGWRGLTEKMKKAQVVYV
jgi:hypothetical protein